ncbi:MAG: BMP family ABC transporter substrate-binding protein [Treponema sp.]|jgi:basic membrane protein A|nr:BMP family ABC transporter substrate-binding protein [Treponema sp.]
MKKAFAILFACLVLFASCSKGGGKAPETSEKFKVLLISGLEGDKSFADSAMIGAKKAIADFGVEISYSQSGDPAEFENQVITGAEEGFDLVVCAASQWLEFIEKHAPNYPNVMFGITDTNAKGDNVCSVTFAQNQGSFLAGAAAAMFTEMTEFSNVNQDPIIGWVGGVDIPALRDFFLGYTEGARYINPNVKILQSFAGSWYDPLKGKELTAAMYEQGADIVMNVASATGNGILEAAAENKRYAIGVDMNQDGEQPGAILTSMIKENGQGIYYIIKKAVEDRRFTGNPRIYMDLEYGGVNLTDMSVIKSFCGDQQKASIDRILAKIDEIKKDIASGKIVVSNYEGYGKNAN